MAKAKKAGKPSAKAKAKKTLPKSISKDIEKTDDAVAEDLEALLDEEKIIEDTFYVVNGSNKPVTLEIFLNAPGQTANSRIELDDDVVKERHDGSLDVQPLEENATLAGRTLFIATTVTNTSGQKRKAKATVRLKGGQMPAEDVLSKTLEVGETVTFKYICKFFKARQ